MRILFIRHAEAVEAGDFAGSDLDRPLTASGRKAMRRAARRLAAHYPRPQRILCSAAARARATADLLARAWDRRVVVTAQLNPGASPEAIQRLVATQRRQRVEWLVVVGHEPDLSSAISRLVAGGRLHVKLKKGACAEVEWSPSRTGVLRALVSPALLDG